MGLQTSGRKFDPAKTTLADNRSKRPTRQFCVVRYNNRYSIASSLALHDNMTSALADLGKAVFGQDRADLTAAENGQLNQPQPRFGSRKLRRAAVA